MRWKNRKKSSGFRFSKSKILFLAFFLLIALLAYSFLRTSFLTIKSVDVQTEKIACTDSNQIKESSGLLGMHIILFDLSRAENTLKNNFFCIKDVEFERKLPDH